MLLRLALAMGRTAAELEATLSHAEFIEWAAFYRLDPWGEQRADLRAAQIAVATLAPHTPKGSPLPNPRDLLLFPDDRLDLPDDLEAQEQQWMLELKRRG